MGLALKLNFLKGWPNPHIYEEVAAAANATEFGQIDEGKIATLTAAGKWEIGSLEAAALSGTPALRNRMPFVLWNGAGKEGDHGAPFSATQHFAQVNWGGIQGIAFSNPIQFETSQFTGTPAVGDVLTVDANGLLKVGATGDLIVAVCTAASHKMAAGVPGSAGSTSSLSVITVVPDMSKRLVP